MSLTSENGSSGDRGAFNRDFRFCLVNGHHRPDGPCPKSADSVAKVVLPKASKILRAAGAVIV